MDPAQGASLIAVAVWPVWPGLCSGWRSWGQEWRSPRWPGTLWSKFVAAAGVFPRRGSSVSQTSPGRGGHQRSRPASGLRSWGGNPATEIPPGAPLGPCASLHSFL